MRIAVNDYAGFSFPFELSSELSKRGHNVLHLFTKASGGPKASFIERNCKKLKIVNINIADVEKDNLLKRWMIERRYGNFATLKIESWQPDVIISANTPLEAQNKIINWAYRNNVRSIYWLQDLLSIAFRSIFYSFNKILDRVAYCYLNKLEIKALSKANHIVTITDDFIPILKKWNIKSEKISIIRNWGTIEQIPVVGRKNSFSLKYGLNEKFVVLYSGTLGKKQNITLVADTAKRLVKEKDILFVIATDIRGKKLLEQKIDKKNNNNILQLPLQSTKLYPYLLASSDVSLVTLEENAGIYCVPSKTWSAFCAQRPSIVAVDKCNLCARITEGVGTGIVIPPGSVGECVKAVKKLKSDKWLRDEMGKNARRYAERHFPISKIANEFETIIHKIVKN